MTAPSPASTPPSGSADPSAPVLEADGLRKVFRDFWNRPRTTAVDGVSLCARPGEVLGLLGPNGSGKSTTIRMLLGLLRPTAGRVRLFGLPPDASRARARLGYLPELSNLHKFLTPWETLEYYGGLFGLSAAERRARIPNLLDSVGIARKDAHRAIAEFSKGMARRVGLAQALINDPDLVVLDEPTSGLDPIGRHDVKEMIRHLREQGKTILLSSHLLGEVADVCTRVIILVSGRIHAEGELSALLQEDDRFRFTLGNLTPEAVDEIRAFLARYADADGVRVDHPSVPLEDFFLQAVGRAAPSASAPASAAAPAAPPAAQP